MLLIDIINKGLHFSLWSDLVKLLNCKVFVETFLLPTDAHNVKKHRVIKTF